MAGTFDDWTYGDEPKAVSVPLQAALEQAVIPKTPESILKPEPPLYADVKKAKEAAGKAVTPEEVAVVAEHKQKRREREALEQEASQRRFEEKRVLAEAPPGVPHVWALVALMQADEATDDREKTSLYDDAINYLQIERQNIVRRGRESKKSS